MSVAKTQRGRRALTKREPKLIENNKVSMIMKGPKTSDIITHLLADLHKLKEPNSKMFHKNNPTRPFEDASSVEFFSQANDASLFAYGSHSKKRPHNLVLGRLFDHQMLDMFELGVESNFQAMSAFGARQSIVRFGSKPCFIFQGDGFENNTILQQFKLFLLDFFRGEVLPKINLASLDHVIIVTAVDTKIHFRHYGVVLKKSGTKYPRIELEEVGPHIDFILRRHKVSSDDLMKASLKQAKAAVKQQDKNVETSLMGDRQGRIYMQRQDLSNLAISKLDGLKKRKRNTDENDAASVASTVGLDTDTESIVSSTSTASHTFNTDGQRVRNPTKVSGRAKAAGFGGNFTNTKRPRT